MVTSIVTTDPLFGPWNIPARAQNLMMNQYAHQKGIKIDTIIPEPLFSASLSTTRWVKENKGLDRILLCSIHQLDCSKREELIEALSDLEIYFCLEDLSGKGKEFLTGVFQELDVFKSAEKIAYSEVKNYQDMQNRLRANPS